MNKTTKTEKEWILLLELEIAELKEKIIEKLRILDSEVDAEEDWIVDEAIKIVKKA